MQPQRLLDEYRDRERRKFSVVIYNASESQAEDSSKRNKDEVSFVNATEELGIPLGEIVQVGKLGQKSSDKKRPLRVQFTDLDHRSLLLRSAKKLHKTTQYNNVNVNPDLSYQERQFQKGLRQELARRKSTSEKGILIYNGQIVNLVQHGTPTTGNPPPKIE